MNLTIKLHDYRKSLTTYGNRDIPITINSELKSENIFSKTPIQKVSLLGKQFYAKLECLLPLTGVKDRLSYYIVQQALKYGIRWIVDATSGRYGLSLAYLAASVNIGTVLYVERESPPSLIRLLSKTEAHLYTLPHGMKVASSSRFLKERAYKIGPKSWAPCQALPEWSNVYAQGLAIELREQIPHSRFRVFVPSATGNLASGLKQALTNCSVHGISNIELPSLWQFIRFRTVFEWVFRHVPTGKLSRMTTFAALQAKDELNEIPIVILLTDCNFSHLRETFTNIRRNCSDISENLPMEIQNSFHFDLLKMERTGLYNLHWGNWLT